MGEGGNLYFFFFWGGGYGAEVKRCVTTNGMERLRQMRSLKKTGFDSGRRSSRCGRARRSARRVSHFLRVTPDGHQIVHAPGMPRRRRSRTRRLSPLPDARGDACACTNLPRHGRTHRSTSSRASASMASASLMHDACSRMRTSLFDGRPVALKETVMEAPPPPTESQRALRAAHRTQT